MNFFINGEFNLNSSTFELLRFPISYSHLEQPLKTNIPRDADLHAEDDFSYTPVVLAAEAGSRESDGLAFESLMKSISDDIHDVNKNPLFQALKVGDKALQAVKVTLCLH